MSASQANTHNPAIQWYRLAVLQDNYIWIVRNHKNDTTIVIDPATAKDVTTFLEKKGFGLQAILNTHHHWDHVGGNKELYHRYKPHIYGAAKDAKRIPFITHPLHDKNTLRVGDMHFQILAMDGHTLGHIAYFETKQHWLFCGDTLFSLGCGRLFEGTAKQMLTSLNTIRNLPPDTLVFCAHEYTLDNARFARSIGFAPEGIKALHTAIEKKRKNHLATIPFVLSDELQFNPFLRTHTPYMHSLMHSLSGLPSHTSHKTTSLEAFTWLRKQKDGFH